MPRILLPVSALVFALGGCAWWSPYVDETVEPLPENRVEAFEEVDQPRRGRPGSAEGGENLSSDIERLQDARARYNAAQDQRAAAVRRRQAECRESEGGRQIPIEDGSQTPASYCEQKPAE